MREGESWGRKNKKRRAKERRRGKSIQVKREGKVGREEYKCRKIVIYKLRIKER